MAFSVGDLVGSSGLYIGGFHRVSGGIYWEFLGLNGIY